VVPALWFPEFASGVLVAERKGGISASTSASFLGFVDTLPIEQDTARPASTLGTVMMLARLINSPLTMLLTLSLSSVSA